MRDCFAKDTRNDEACVIARSVLRQSTGGATKQSPGTRGGLLRKDRSQRHRRGGAEIDFLANVIIPVLKMTFYMERK
jgi:hypothetical protein